MSRFDKLARRERQVAELLALGYTCTEITALGDFGSVKTVDTHRRAALAKLGVRNAVELARIALRDGVVKLPPADGPEPAVQPLPSHLVDARLQAVR